VALRFAPLSPDLGVASLKGEMGWAVVQVPRRMGRAVDQGPRRMGWAVDQGPRIRWVGQ